nr:PREDICTED: COMM domain-containing protein 10 [Anolis carolinensis]|eukprot:XP_016850355.1 PREDICTED: COMM domain-containing protein 10 [Anolis carolinensis]
MAAPMIIPDTGSIRKAVSLINAIDTGKFSRLLSRILQKLHLKVCTEKNNHILVRIYEFSITFFKKQAVYHNLKPTILKQQLEHFNLNPDKVEVLATAWAASGPEVVEKFRQRILSPHKLDSVGWQLNLQMAQSTQAKQKSPKAVLELGITNEDSKNMEKVFVEFSHEELFEFYNKLESIQAQLDSLT